MSVGDEIQDAPTSCCREMRNRALDTIIRPRHKTKIYNMQNDGFFNITQDSNHDVDNDVVSIDSQMNPMDDDDIDVQDDD